MQSQRLFKREAEGALAHEGEGCAKTEQRFEDADLEHWKDAALLSFAFGLMKLILDF